MYPDIFFTPEYQSLFKDTAFGGEPRCFRSAGIEYRFYVRPVEQYFDIVSPYGYSGPLEIRDEEHGTVSWLTFLADFHEYCQRESIIAEFARLHPFLMNHTRLQPFGGVVQSGEVVYLDLTQPLKFDKGCKSAITKANRTASKTLATFIPSDFKNIYEQTMKRRGASPDYYFPPQFFEKLTELSGVILGAWYSDDMVSCISVLSYGDYVHYFLSGSNLTYHSLNANNLLLAEAIKWAKLRGYKIFNVGGTFAGDKGLFSFKKSFSKLTKPFYTYRKVHNQEVYDRLCQGKEPSRVGYFPAYRQ